MFKNNKKTMRVVFCVCFMGVSFVQAGKRPCNSDSKPGKTMKKLLAERDAKKKEATGPSFDAQDQNPTVDITRRAAAQEAVPSCLPMLQVASASASGSKTKEPAKKALKVLWWNGGQLSEVGGNEHVSLMIDTLATFAMTKAEGKDVSFNMPPYFEDGSCVHLVRKSKAELDQYAGRHIVHIKFPDGQIAMIVPNTPEGKSLTGEAYIFSFKEEDAPFQVLPAKKEEARRRCQIA